MHILVNKIVHQIEVYDQKFILMYTRKLHYNKFIYHIYMSKLHCCVLFAKYIWMFIHKNTLEEKLVRLLASIIF